jgi:hypothetical protein
MSESSWGLLFFVHLETGMGRAIVAVPVAMNTFMIREVERKTQALSRPRGIGFQPVETVTEGGLIWTTVMRHRVS